MNILLINHYAGSPRHGMAFRPYYLAREWVRLGHRVHIIASEHSHIRARQPDLRGKARLDETIDNIEYSWYRTPTYCGNGIGRVKNMATFIAALYRDSKQWAQSYKPDVVIASSTYPMDIWPAHRISTLAKAKLLFEVHDLWPLSPMELGGMSKWHPFIMVVQKAEDYAYRHADGVVSILPKVREYMVSRGLAPEKLHLVPNGIDPTEWIAGSRQLPDRVIRVLAALREQGNAIVGYAGTHGVSNALDNMLSAGRLMLDEKVAFVLVGCGPDKASLQERAARENLSNVYFLDPVEKSQIPSLLQCFDIAYIGWHRHPLYRFGIAPNKLMDYMMAARPVLHAAAAGNDPVEEARCGVTVEPDNPEAAAVGIRGLLRLSIEERTAMGQRGKAFVLDNLTYPVLGQRFLAACSHQ
ncbi:glycosyltransferase family 4 protein [Massilia litorea]|uniref:Glycosyltransferase family 4 protein n=1 Tax=Massilia litorea TaxID=2769491 RepID=A0A7L9UB21_9BURK|nr:glycosyltransferase family 4 protein [Massilia litorea]QOL52261.1 glycosyltransferase family 4 protein [Massilia litorea]